MGNGISLLALAAATAALTVPGLAQAQERTAADPRIEEGTDPSSNEIIVTAQRREQRLQDVPISITAVTSDALDVSGVETIRSLNMVAPSITVSQTPTGTVSAYIRGIGSSSANIGDEPSVATYIDGFYLPTANQAFFSLGNVERIEVLKGPQGTLFGRNASGGVIQVITADPSYMTSLRANVGYSSFDTVDGSVYATTGIADGIAFDIAGQLIDQGKGWGKNLTTGSDVNKTDSRSIRSKLLLEPNDDFRAVLSAGYVKVKSDVGNARSSPPGGNIAINIPIQGDIYDTLQNTRGVGQTARQYIFQSTLTYDLGTASLKNLAQHIDYRQNFLVDVDYGPLDLVNVSWIRQDRIFTEELQIIGDSGGPIDWIAGAFYMRYSSGYDPGMNYGSAIGGRIGVFPHQVTKSFAPYVQGTVGILPNTHLTGGFRYTFEHKDFSFGQNLNGGSTTTASATLKQEKPTWRLSIDHKLSDHVMIYASYDRGYKSGGFNVSKSPVGQTPVDPEVVDAFEIGAKTQFLDNAVTLNVAAFYDDFRGLQLQRLSQLPSGLIAAVLTNAAESTIKGIEFEIMAQPVRGLTLNAMGTFLSARYDSFPGAGFYTRNPNGTGTSYIGDASGYRAVRSPKFAMSAGFDYNFDIGASNLTASGKWYHNSGFYFEPDHRLRQGAYDLLDARLRFEPAGSPFGLSVFATNITDRQYYVNAAASALGDNATPGEPRVIGVSLDVQI